MSAIGTETLLSQLKWRYATKQFDPTRKIDPQTWAALEESLILSPSSFGLQPWRFYVITDRATKEKLVPLSWGQRQLADASHVVVFAVKHPLLAVDVRRHIERMAQVRGGSAEEFMAFENLVNDFLENPPDALDIKAWSSRQVYIALGSFMTSAALLGVDTCPMEGLDPAGLRPGARPRGVRLLDRGGLSRRLSRSGGQIFGPGQGALRKKRHHHISPMNPVLKGVIPLVIIIILLVVVLSGLGVVIEAGHVGVLKTLGAVRPEPLREGFHLKKPFVDQVEQMDIRLTASHAQATAASKDLQTVSTEVTTQYSMNGDMAPLTYQRIGNLGKVSATLVEPAIQECVKSVTAKFTAEELVTKREVVKLQIQQSLVAYINNTLKEKGVENAISIANLAITDFNFSPEFNRAIESKVQAEQQALQAKNEKLKRVTQAEAAAAERQLSADAEAYSTEVQSKARAEAIRREADALRQSPELIQLRAVERWDGVLPRVNGSQMVPFLNIGSELEQKPGR